MSDATQDIRHTVNVKIGQRIRDGRKLRGLSQKQLGSIISQPITFQQIQKYEKGTNRISLCVLCDLANSLELPLLYFLEDLDEIKSELADVERQLLEKICGISLDAKKALMVLLDEKTAA